MDALFIQQLAYTRREIKIKGQDQEAVYDYTFPDTLWLYRLTKIPPKKFQNLDNITFARDRDFSYKNVLFCALDFDILFLMATIVTFL